MTAVDMGPEGATAGNTAVPYGLRWLTIDKISRSLEGARAVGRWPFGIGTGKTYEPGPKNCGATSRPCSYCWSPPTSRTFCRNNNYGCRTPSGQEGSTPPGLHFCFWSRTDRGCYLPRLWRRSVTSFGAPRGAFHHRSLRRYRCTSGHWWKCVYRRMASQGTRVRARVSDRGDGTAPPRRRLRG